LIASLGIGCSTGTNYSTLLDVPLKMVDIGSFPYADFGCVMVESGNVPYPCCRQAGKSAALSLLLSLHKQRS
jgi:hypothetical protein